MAKQNKFNLKNIDKKARKALEAAIVDVGNTARVFFIDNFRKQGLMIRMCRSGSRER
jgi:hypothetical protein